MASASATRVRIGKLLVGAAVLLPALAVVALYLVLHADLVGRRFNRPIWPWIAADVVMMAIGALMMRGDEL